MLTRLAVAVWLGWLGGLVLMAGLLIGRVPHPHFLPMTAAIGTAVGAGLALIGGAGWRLVRGPRRARTLACLLLGVAPLGFLASHILYGLRAGYGRQIDLDLPLKLLMPFGESFLDLEARVRYPRRTEGAKVVMISAATVDRPRAQVDAMDRHVLGLEARLGRRVPWRVHWVRGPLFGFQGRAIFGLCLGSRPGEQAVDDEGLSGLDRHEVAHCAINGFCSAASDPPAVLSEGWADACGGLDPTALALRARRHRDEGGALSLRELVGPDWYGRHQWPAYVQGAPLVHSILQRFGPDRFLALYATCRRATFAADCRRILGVGLDDLDAAYRADIERLAGRSGAPARQRLERLRLGPGVEPAAWTAFLDEYCAAADRLVAPYEHVRMTYNLHYKSTDAHGSTTESDQRYSFTRSGALLSWRRLSGESEEAYLAHPRRSLEAERERPTTPWTVRVDPRAEPARSYRRIRAAIERREIIGSMTAILLGLADEMGDLADPSGVVVTELARVIEDGHPYVRVRLEDRSPAGWVPWRSFTTVLAVDDGFAPRSDAIETGGGATIRGEFAYDRHEGRPVLCSCHRTGSGPNGERTATRTAVVDRRFGPVPESEFDPDRFLDGPRVIQSVDPNPSMPETPWWADWYGVPLGAGAFALASGLAIAASREVRRVRPEPGGPPGGG
ncbi:MAG TPA: hypothetical protein VF590_25900 [Isosphaeraceae bacterium]